MSNREITTVESEVPVQKTQKSSVGGLSVFSDAQSFNTALRMANCLASSTVVPKEYQGNIGNCMIAIEMSSRINTSPMMVMQNLFIVNGRPGWSSQWIIAMINSSRRYKTELQFEFGNAKEDGGLSCRAWAEDYSGHRVYGPKISMTMANAEGWTNKNGSKWKTMPEVMIQYRAASFFGRMNCPDMIMGIYSSDEILDMGEYPEDVTVYSVDNKSGQVVEENVIPGESGNTPISQEQRQALFKVANEHLGEKANEVLKSLLADMGYDSTDGMPTSVYNIIMKQVVDIAQDSNNAGEEQPLEETVPEAETTAE